MKFAVILSLLLSSAFASATTLKVYEAPAYDFFPDQDPFYFGVNEELGRAWGVVHEVDNRWDESVQHETKLKVPGLSYDATRGMIVFNNGSETIDCATRTVKGKWVFQKQIITETGRCTFELKTSMKTHDDGFNTKDVKYYEVYFTAE